MNRIDIHVKNIEEPSWIKSLRQFGLLILQEIGKRNWCVSVLLCDDIYMRELNASYRDTDTTTDVLSFPQEEVPSFGRTRTAGDVVISVDTMFRQAKEAAVPANEELKRLFVHGVLHLDGMDHDEAGEGEMMDLQERLLAEFGGVTVL